MHSMLQAMSTKHVRTWKRAKLLSTVKYSTHTAATLAANDGNEASYNTRQNSSYRYKQTNTK